MDIIVNDTNIFIDLLSVGLLKEFFELPFEVVTVDFVIDEIKNPMQKESLAVFIQEGSLIVENFNTEELDEIITEHMAVPGNLSLTDCSVCYYARNHLATLLTGDRQLRKYAEKNNVAVRGILFVFDEFVEHNIIESHMAARKLSELFRINNRLPKSEIERRIKKWTNSRQ